MAQMLYYPGSKPPEAVLFQAVLYWDSIASITPHEPEWRRQAEQTAGGRVMLELRDRGLYEPISLFSEPDALRSAFSHERDRLLAQIAVADLKPPVEDSASDAVSNWYSVSRFPEEWTQWLVEHGLARWREQDKEVWVDTKLRHVLFAVAADYLVRLNDGSDAYGPRRFTYTGDDGFFWAVNSPSATGRRCWQLDIGALFPMPAPGTDIGRVIAFRERYKDERHRLIHQVSKLQQELATVYDENPYEIFQAMRTELVAAVENLDQAARASKLTWIYRGLLSFMALGASTAVVMTPSTAPLAITMPVLGGIAVNLTTNKISSDRPADTNFRYLQRTKSEHGAPISWSIDR